jgi:hypothetical protein
MKKQQNKEQTLAYTYTKLWIHPLVYWCRICKVWQRNSTSCSVQSVCRTHICFLLPWHFLRNLYYVIQKQLTRMLHVTPNSLLLHWKNLWWGWWCWQNQEQSSMRFEILMAVSMQIMVFWDMMPCSLVEPATSIFRVEECTTWETYLSCSDGLRQLQFMWMHEAPKMLGVFQILCHTYFVRKFLHSSKCIDCSTLRVCTAPKFSSHWVKCLVPPLLSFTLSLLIKTPQF